MFLSEFNASMLPTIFVSSRQLDTNERFLSVLANGFGVYNLGELVFSRAVIGFGLSYPRMNDYFHGQRPTFVVHALNKIIFIKMENLGLLLLSSRRPNEDRILSLHCWEIPFSLKKSLKWYIR